METVTRNQIRILSVFGTRPEAIKMAPLVKHLESLPEIESLICLTGQHRELPDAALRCFDLRADYELGIMQRRQALSDVTCRALTGMEDVLERARPDLVLVHGDTTTTLAGALAAFYHHIPVGHVEAGLRTGNRLAPWPEEINRTLVSDLAELHFCPTQSNRRNLESEGVQGSVFVTGNTVIDAMKTTVRADYRFHAQELRDLNLHGRKMIVLTCHRRENQGAPMVQIMEAVRKLALRHEDLELVYPVHPNPTVRETVFRVLGGTPCVRLIEPLDVEDMHNLLSRCRFVMTDSGGLQEEAPALGKPVLVLRDTTERPEALAYGTVKLVGTKEETVLAAAEELLSDERLYQRMACTVSPYGDGHASERIAQGILWHFGLRDKRPQDFEPYGMKEQNHENGNPAHTI